MPETAQKTAKVIALCGKGGVGKTSLSAMTVRALTQNPKNRVLAIDADPAVGLSTALGIEVKKTVDDIRSDLVSRLENGDFEDKAQLNSSLDYEMFSALEEIDNLAFLAIGRPEKAGCYCKVNEILKDIIAAMVENFDYVVIDGEAGVEQVNRRVMDKVSHLVLVSDGSRRGLNVVKTIQKVSESAIVYDQVGLILNRLRSQDEMDSLNIDPELNCLGWVPEDDTIRSRDIEGLSILEAPDSLAVNAARNCLSMLDLPGL